MLLDVMHATTAWHTLFHEWVHVILGDAGVQLEKDESEAVCDAIASARTRELMDGGFAP